MCDIECALRACAVQDTLRELYSLLELFFSQMK
eukprot:COSAG05_NODE_16521_length_344_cov_0.836735_1_plen_32_part_10